MSAWECFRLTIGSEETVARRSRMEGNATLTAILSAEIGELMASNANDAKSSISSPRALPFRVGVVEPEVKTEDCGESDST